MVCAGISEGDLVGGSGAIARKITASNQLAWAVQSEASRLASRPRPGLVVQGPTRDAASRRIGCTCRCWRELG